MLSSRVQQNERVKGGETRLRRRVLDLEKLQDGRPVIGDGNITDIVDKHLQAGAKRRYRSKKESLLQSLRTSRAD